MAECDASSAFLTEERCIADGCRRAAEKGRKHCHGHRKREKMGQPMGDLREYGADPDAYLEQKALEYAGAKDMDEAQFRRARRYLRRAAMWYAKAVLGLPRRRPKVPTTPDTQSQG